MGRDGIGGRAEFVVSAAGVSKRCRAARLISLLEIDNAKIKATTTKRGLRKAMRSGADQGSKRELI